MHFKWNCKTQTREGEGAAAELAEKSARLAELDAELNMDEHDAEEKAAEPEGRSSVLADLKAKAAIVGNTPRQHVAHEVAR